MTKQYFFYRSDGLLKRIYVDDIFFLETEDNYTKFYTSADNPLLIRISLSAALNLLPKNKFAQIHRSYAVSLEHVGTVGRDYVMFANVADVQLPLSRRFYAAFVKKIVILETDSADIASEELQ